MAAYCPNFLAVYIYGGVIHTIRARRFFCQDIFNCLVSNKSTNTKSKEFRKKDGDVFGSGIRRIQCAFRVQVDHGYP